MGGCQIAGGISARPKLNSMKLAGQLGLTAYGTFGALRRMGCGKRGIHVIPYAGLFRTDSEACGKAAESCENGRPPDLHTRNNRTVSAGSVPIRAKPVPADDAE
jgi:hypothetical protein